MPKIKTLATYSADELTARIGQPVYAVNDIRFKGYRVRKGEASVLRTVEDRTRPEWSGRQYVGVDSFPSSPYKQYAGGSIVNAVQVSFAPVALESDDEIRARASAYARDLQILTAAGAYAEAARMGRKFMREMNKLTR